MITLPKEDIELLLSFCPEGDEVPKGLNPMFYFTLTAEGDQRIMDRLNAIRAKVNQPYEQE